MKTARIAVILLLGIMLVSGLACEGDGEPTSLLGAYLVYEADFSEVPSGAEGDAIEVTRGIIEKRINRYGVSNPVIQIIDSDRISAFLPGVSLKEAEELVGTVAELDFREQKGVDATLAEAANGGDIRLRSTMPAASK